MSGEPLEIVVTRHAERIEGLDDWRKAHAKHHDKLEQTVDEIRNRPTWQVTYTITALFGLVCTLATYIITHP